MPGTEVRSPAFIVPGSSILPRRIAVDHPGSRY
jgi:hypothetical protein